MIYKVLRVLVLIICKILFRCEIVGAEKLPKEGSLIIAPNHKSNWDPVLVSVLVKPQIHWMAKKELYDNKFLAAILNSVGVFPIDRDGKDIAAIKTAMKKLRNNEILGIFPEGTRVEEPNFTGVKSGVALLAHRTKTPIIPMYIDGNYKVFRKMKVYVRDPIDLSEYPKLTQKDYDRISQDMIKSIYYGGVDKNKNLSS
jgi:1-acyl-sn-glycerol-3-phosphate acyltransferase